MAQIKEFKQIIVEEEDREFVYEILNTILSVTDIKEIIAKFADRKLANDEEQLELDFPKDKCISYE
jgi:SHS2 domain-containing protein